MRKTIREVPLKRVTITDGFWSARQRLIADTAVPYMEKILRDEIPGAEKSHAIENFRIAAGEAQGDFYGMVFQDSDVAKWIETASYSLLVKPDPALEARLDRLIETISRAQGPDGYLNTYFTLREPDARWTNLLECHELYCAGHMIEAAVAHFEVTGKRSLLNVALRLADHIVDRFLDDCAVPGHQEIEIGLMRLYRATGEAKYRDMAKRFLDLRGQDPDYFQEHTPAHPGVHYGGYDIDPADTDYNQTYAPIREQREARGHAVRCMYMLTAMADVAEATRDDTLLAACERLWENITGRQMYVTGGLGASARHEAFLQDFELPNDTAYAETCASVAMGFFSQRMLNLAPEGRYADVLELELYNGALSGMQLDAARYFYVNPLEVDPAVAGKAPGYEHVLPERQRWMACACCPPNLARQIASLGRYCWSESEDAVYSHLFIGSRAQTKHAEIELTTGYPWNGGAAYVVHPRTEGAFALKIRVPGYLNAFKACLNGTEIEARVERGYLAIGRVWREGDRVELEFELEARRLYADPRVRADEGCVALARGPFVYCFEGIDNPHPLGDLRLPKEAALETGENASLGVCTLRARGRLSGAAEETALTAIPYYAWSNRGACTMRVWMREV